MILILMVYDSFKEKLIERFIIEEEFIVSRKLLGLFQIVELFTTIITGILDAFMRFLVFAGFLIMSLSRLDKSVYPGWVPLKDAGYKIYLSAVKMHHYHNNPTTCVFANILAGSLDNYHHVWNSGDEGGKAGYMLAKDPEKKEKY